MPRITNEEHKRRRDILLDLVRDFKTKNPETDLSVNKANDMLYSRVNARMNANTVKEVIRAASKQPAMRREATRAAPSEVSASTAGETIKVNLRDGREVYVVVL